MLNQQKETLLDDVLLMLADRYFDLMALRDRRVLTQIEDTVLHDSQEILHRAEQVRP